MSAEQTTAVTTVSTQLTVAQRAVIALGFDEKKEQELRGLAAKTADITTITNADGRAQVHAARMVLKNQRLQLKDDAETARQDATKYSKAVIALEKRAIAIISTEEDRLEALQDAWDAKLEAEKQARIDAEIRRRESLEERVAELRGNQTLTSLSDPALIAEHISDLEQIPVDDSFEELRQQADDAKVAGLSRLRALHAAAVERENEQARIKADREELARLRAENEEHQAVERERLAAEEHQAQVARDAEAASQLEAQQRNAAALQEIQGIQQQVIIASSGRAGVRKGGTLACIDETLAETESWIIDERFGVFVESARQAKESALATIKSLRESFLQRQEAEKIELERQSIAKAAQDKIDADRAALEREQAESRRVKEEEERQKREQARLASIKKPADAELLGVLAAHYQVPTTKVVEWVLALDLSSVKAA